MNYQKDCIESQRGVVLSSFKMSDMDASLGESSTHFGLLRSAADRFVLRTVVFRHTQEATYSQEWEHVPGAWLTADEQTIHSLFGDDRKRCRLFERFLKRGWLGVFLAHGEEWISYGWSTQPGTGSPPHLPKWIGDLQAYWILCCHTKKSFRGQGIYRRLLARIVALSKVRKAGPIYSDALPENSSSQRAMLSSGFIPCGQLTTYKLWIPRLTSVAISGRWSKS
jgi:RimJ/RimL family protein N-acetyltransferase